MRFAENVAVVTGGAVCPHEINTPMLRSGFERRGLDPQKAVEELNRTVPLGHIAEPEEIADVMVFLASDEARYIAGETVEVTGGGSIINIGSIEGLGVNPHHAAYCASKAGVHGMTRAMAVDLGPHGIRCNAIAPGWVASELSETYLGSRADPAAAREALNRLHPGASGGPPTSAISPHSLRNGHCRTSPAHLLGDAP